MLELIIRVSCDPNLFALYSMIKNMNIFYISSRSIL